MKDSAPHPMEETPVVSIDQLQPSVTESLRPVAPLWHTLVLVLILVGTSVSGAYSQHIAARTGHLMTQYAAQIVWEWVLLLYVVWGVRRRGISFRNLIGGRWERFEDFLLD